MTSCLSLNPPPFASSRAHMRRVLKCMISLMYFKTPQPDSTNIVFGANKLSYRMLSKIKEKQNLKRGIPKNLSELVDQYNS